MAIDNPIPSRLRTTASAFKCDCCPPDRVCAWACLQGAGIEEIIIGAALALEGVPGRALAEPGVEATSTALWDSFNTLGN